MKGLSKHLVANSNQLLIQIPDEMKGQELQIFILPISKNKEEEIEFFSEEELEKFGTIKSSTDFFLDNEDYSKW